MLKSKKTRNKDGPLTKSVSNLKKTRLSKPCQKTNSFTISPYKKPPKKTRTIMSQLKSMKPSRTQRKLSSKKKLKPKRN